MKECPNEDPRRIISASRLGQILIKFRSTSVVVAVIFTIISSAFLFMVGLYNGLRAMIDFITTLVVKDALSGLIKTMDIFLAAMVMMLLAVGLYDQFVTHCDELDDIRQLGQEGFNTLDILKNNLAKLIIILLIFTFLELVLANLDRFVSWEVLIVPAGVCLIAAGLKMISNK